VVEDIRRIKLVSIDRNRRNIRLNIQALHGDSLTKHHFLSVSSTQNFPQSSKSQTPATLKPEKVTRKILGKTHSTLPSEASPA